MRIYALLKNVLLYKIVPNPLQITSGFAIIVNRDGQNQ